MIFAPLYCTTAFFAFQYLNLDRYAVGQGALACECRQGDARIQALLSTIHNEAPALACIAERAFMSRLEGGCSTPIAVRTQINPGGVAGIEGLSHFPSCIYLSTTIVSLCRVVSVTTYS